uniref:RNA polymerase II-associated protein 3 n=1 Tax=Erigeron canadensis TaxID=72917 RepID=UPI001CB8A87A|nr:RNA polymerase II-associated protein 3 [Erigeron canadensis]
MARVPSKHDRDHSPLDFKGFLSNLQDFDASIKDSRKFNSQSHTDNMKAARNMGKSTPRSQPGVSRQDDYLKKFDQVGQLSSSFMSSDVGPVDANSEKELGNEFFKQRKYKEAVDCYSKSIALSPTAVAYANRAMAYLKLKRFQEAEDDCTEALNLDDRYIKAYSRRSTARKELGKLKDSKDDADFALRLEPHNKEIKMQYAEAKSLYDKELIKKASASLKEATQGLQKELKLDNGPQSTPKISETTVVAATKTESCPETFHNVGKKALKESVHELAARAASLATAEAAKDIVPPTTAYQFEASWRGFSGNHALQARLLKATDPVMLPQIFKNALSAPLLIDIIRCIATIFIDEADLAVKFLENLPNVPRFNMIIMCLSPTDKSDLRRIWDEVFCKKEIAQQYLEVLQLLHPRYCIQ